MSEPMSQNLLCMSSRGGVGSGCGVEVAVVPAGEIPLQAVADSFERAPFGGSSLDVGARAKQPGLVVALHMVRLAAGNPWEFGEAIIVLGSSGAVLPATLGRPGPSTQSMLAFAC
ncbi:hypothetical protein [Kocuria aegyptia]|uniref:hypothetical protein n=1 Tax=Kocuria aegyptia TaxID=330943 RepID=UPI0031CEF3F0